MRLLFPVLLIVLAVIIVGFVIMNPAERVTVMLPFSTPQTDVPLFLVVFASLAVGVGFTAIIAVLEGATIRLANRRLRKEAQRLETEMNFMKVQPQDPADVEIDPVPPVRREETRPTIDRLPDAPVYGVEPEDSVTRSDP